MRLHMLLPKVPVYGLLLSVQALGAHGGLDFEDPIPPMGGLSAGLYRMGERCEVRRAHLKPAREHGHTPRKRRSGSVKYGVLRREGIGGYA